MSKTAFLFPGQGSQFVGMGSGFHAAENWARDLFSQADEITGKPITRLCFEGPLEELTLTANLQPAVTAVNLVCLKALAEKGIVPDAVAGHSLGEYTALAAAGVITQEAALKLSSVRGELMDRDARANPGSMQAVVGLTMAELEGIVELARSHGRVVVANHNSTVQIVISGESEAVATAAKFAQAKGGKTMPLPVSGAWHSPLLESAAEDFFVELDQVPFAWPRCDMYLNVTGRKETDPAAMKIAMAKQMLSPVKWCDTINNMLADGVTRFVEVGPKKVLTGLVRKTVPREVDVLVINVQDPAGVDAAVEKLG